ncbi:MAG: DMT family transporter [Gemmatimonadetes bacterium]|nr:DMT family transporter [Gemmatimonadota bacterium]
MQTVTKGMLAVLISSLGYGSLPILAKLALEAGVGVIPLLTWRFVFGSALIWVFVLAARRSLPTRRQVLGLIGLGTLYAGNSLAYMLGLDRVSASLASIVFFAWPAVAVLLARVWIGEPLSSRRVSALALALIGSTLTVSSGVGGGDVPGILLILLAVALLASFVVHSDSAMHDVPGIAGTATFLTTTAVVIALSGLLFGSLAVPLEPRPVALLTAIAVWSTAIPITLFVIGIQWIGPARASIFATIEPALTLSLAALVLGDRLTTLQWVGAGSIVAGVVWLRLERPTTDSAH